MRAPSLAKSMSQYLIDQINSTTNIEVRVCSELVEAQGEERLETVTIACSESGKVEVLPATALFILIGAQPRTDWLAGVVERDSQGFIRTGPDLASGANRRPKGWPLERDPFLLEASVPGIFVAGDVRYGSVKRVASGVGEGSIAVQFIHRYLSEV